MEEEEEDIDSPTTQAGEGVSVRDHRVCSMLREEASVPLRNWGRKREKGVRKQPEPRLCAGTHGTGTHFGLQFCSLNTDKATPPLNSQPAQPLLLHPTPSQHPLRPFQFSLSHASRPGPLSGKSLGGARPRAAQRETGFIFS